MRKIAVYSLLLAIACATSACETRPRTVVLYRASATDFIVRDLCGAGLSSVAAYRIEDTGALTDAEIEWGVRSKNDSAVVTEITLFKGVPGYELIQKQQALPPDYDYYVLADSFIEFDRVRTMNIGAFIWENESYSQNEGGDVVAKIEQRYPSLKGSCAW